MKCPNCGKQIANDSSFCEDLETKKCNLQNEMNELAKAQRYCPVCGTEKSPGAIFCRQCRHNFTKY